MGNDECKGKWVDEQKGRGGNFKKDECNDKEGGDLKIKDDLWLWGRTSASNFKIKENL